MDELEKYKKEPADGFISEKFNYMEDQHKKDRIKLTECIPLIKAAFKVKGLWEKDNTSRSCEVRYEPTSYNWPSSGLSVYISLTENDSVKDTFECLRPFKYDSPVSFVRFTVNKDSGIVGADYKSKTSEREVEVRIDLGKSRTCKQVQVGTKEVPVYETVCNEENDDLALESAEMNELLT